MMNLFVMNFSFTNALAATESSLIMVFPVSICFAVAPAECYFNEHRRCLAALKRAFNGSQFDNSIWPQVSFCRCDALQQFAMKLLRRNSVNFNFHGTWENFYFQTWLVMIPNEIRSWNFLFDYKFLNLTQSLYRMKFTLQLIIIMLSNISLLQAQLSSKLSFLIFFSRFKSSSRCHQKKRKFILRHFRKLIRLIISWQRIVKLMRWNYTTYSKS